MKLIDFDEIFSEYLNKWYAENKDNYEDFGMLEEAAGGVYEKWIDMPLKETGGISARKYFEKITDAKDLITMLIKYIGGDIAPPDLLAGRISKNKECGRYLAEIARQNTSPELTIMSINILAENNWEGLTQLLTDFLFSNDKSDEIMELTVEHLTERAEASGKEILERAEKQVLQERTKKYMADILVYAEKDDRILRLLLELFKTDKDTALYASYLGKYGDARALPALIEYGKRQDINYLQYMETRNAVEMLGETLENKKDFTGDKYYAALKYMDGEDGGSNQK